MGRKKLNKKEVEFTPVRIFGIVDFIDKKMTKVSLDEIEIDLEIAFVSLQDRNRFCKCEFTIVPKV